MIKPAYVDVQRVNGGIWLLPWNAFWMAKVMNTEHTENTTQTRGFAQATHTQFTKHR